MERICYSETFSEHRLTEKARQSGFTGFYTLQSSLEQPALLALLLGVMSHFAMEYSKPASAWKLKLGTLAVILQTGSSYIHSVPRDFWGKAYHVIEQIAIEALETTELCEETRKLRAAQRLSAQEERKVIPIIGRALQMRTVLLLEDQGEFLAQDDGQDSTPALWVVIGIREDGTCYYFIDRNFRRGREGPGFPFYSESPSETVSFHGFKTIRRSTFSLPEAQAQKLLCDTLRFLIKVIKDIPDPLQQEFAQLKTALSRQGPALNVPAELLSALEKFGSREQSSREQSRSEQSRSEQSRSEQSRNEQSAHPVQKCEKYYGEHLSLDCKHNFHKECLSRALQGLPNFICPICSKEISKATLEKIDAKLAASVPSPPSKGRRNPFASQCSSCTATVKNSDLMKHGSHHVCVKCLSGVSNCPKCGEALSSPDVQWVREKAASA